MDWDLVIKGGTLVTASESKQANLYVKDGKIAAVSAVELPGTCGEVIDAAGKLVFPGFIDTHVHSRDGSRGAHYKEDFFHSSMAGAVGGVTTIYEMPNCNPAIYNVEMLEDLKKTITPKAHTDFGVWGLCLGDLNNSEIEALDRAGVVGFKYFWGYAIDEKTYQLVYNYTPGMQGVIPPYDEGKIFQIFRTVAKTGKKLAIHAEHFDLIKLFTSEVTSAGEKGYAAVLKARPDFSETTVINTAIAFAEQTGCHLHILHLAAGKGVDLIRKAQQRGVPVTGETCPHYLALTDRDAERVGVMIKGYPPVRTQEDQDLLWGGLKDGTLSFVCSDHAPHSAEEKQQDFWVAPAGNATIETMSMILLDAMNKGKITENEVAKFLSENPAKEFGTYPQKGSLTVGGDADFAIVDPNAEYVFHQESMHSRTKLSPYDGGTYRGRVVQTVLRGMTVAKDGEIVGAPRGHFIRPIE